MTAAWFLDLDGTLVDSAPAHEAAFRAALAEVAPALLGGFDYRDHAGAGTGAVAGTLGLAGADAARFVRRKREIYRGHVAAGKVAAFPGAHRLLDRLAALGRPAYLVTAGSRGSVARVLAASGLGDRLGGVLTGDDVPASKPDPAFYRAACERWSVAPAGAAAVEDSAHGAASAVGAGIRTYLVHASGPVPGTVPVRDLDALADLLGGPDA
ncbi:HAD family phosphatase [Actinomadura sp. WMMB 499]|uniref:HAD family hydrolase n=1 Tax=Actinomadura sp. WMMB 499 TaxID=1219491 RepID=UPI0012461905|nr:HAD family phosphatase [Actinomadura sp. WMMB 499]QFG21453.1 HAD family phosphatase [Actinomadura sp. WMMB 499]